MIAAARKKKADATPAAPVNEFVHAQVKLMEASQAYHRATHEYHAASVKFRVTSWEEEEANRSALIRRLEGLGPDAWPTLRAAMYEVERARDRLHSAAGTFGHLTSRDACPICVSLSLSEEI